MPGSWWRPSRRPGLAAAQHPLRARAPWRWLAQAPVWDSRSTCRPKRERVGELMQAQRETLGLAQGKRTDLGLGKTQVDRPTLAEAGIDKNLADRAECSVHATLRGARVVFRRHWPNVLDLGWLKGDSRGVGRGGTRTGTPKPSAARTAERPADHFSSPC